MLATPEMLSKYLLNECLDASGLEVLADAEGWPLPAMPRIANRWHCGHRNGRLLSHFCSRLLPLPELLREVDCRNVCVTIYVLPGQSAASFWQDSRGPVIISGW